MQGNRFRKEVVFSRPYKMSKNLRGFVGENYFRQINGLTSFVSGVEL